MPIGPGSTIDGVYKYGESDATGPLFSDFLNMLGDSIRTRINAIVTLGKIADSGWLNLALINSWAVSGGFTPQYRKLNGVVYFRGRMSGGSGAPFVVPAGYRPGIDSRFMYADGTSGIAVGHMTLSTAGTVVVTGSTVPNLGSIAPFIADN